MRDNSEGGSLFGGLLVGLGFAGLLVLPLVIVRRLGINFSALLAAITMTLFAIVQPDLLTWAQSEALQCGSLRLCPAYGLADMAGSLPTWGWCMVAVGTWAIAFMLKLLDPTASPSETPAASKRLITEAPIVNGLE